MLPQGFVFWGTISKLIPFCSFKGRTILEILQILSKNISIKQGQQDQHDYFASRSDLVFSISSGN